MGERQGPNRGQWTTRLGFILAAAGSAIGLGNIWKFPYITGENGGGAFVLIYLFCIVLVGFPIMIAEVLIGRSTQKSPVGAFNSLTSEKSLWSSVGKMGILAGFVILSYYSVVAGWAMNYFLMSVNTFFHHNKPIPITAPAEIGEREQRMDKVARLMNSAGKKSLEDLHKFIKGSEKDLGTYAAYELGKRPEGEKAKSTEILLKHLQDPGPQLRFWVVRALGWKGVNFAKVVPALIKVYEEDKDLLVRFSALEALGNLGWDGRKAIPTLIQSQNCGDKQIEMAASLALGKIGETITPEPQGDEISYLNQISAPEEKELKEASGLVSQMAPQKDRDKSAETLLKTLKGQNPAARYWAVYTLGKMGGASKKALSALSGLLVSRESPLIRYRAAQALGNLGALEEVPTLIKVLGDANPLVRSAAAWALGKVGAKASDAIPSLVKLLKEDSDGIVKYRAGMALQRIVSTEKGANKEVKELTKNLALPAIRTTHVRDAKEISGLFGKLYGNGPINTFWHFFFMLLTIGIVYQGIQGGIERWARILMPVLFVLLLFLLIYGMVMNFASFWEGFKFTFKPTNKLKPSGVLEALGHAFFTLSLGMGAMITYGSYLGKDDDVPTSSLWVCVFDTVIALMACMVIFPIIFAFGEKPGAGPGLVFITMPVLFSKMTGGLLVSMTFFLLLTFAALTSAISLLEVVASYFIDELNWSRKKATLISGAIIFFFGLPCAAGVIFGDWSVFYGKDFFDTMDYTASNWLLPLGGLLIAIFVGWFMEDDLRKKEFQSGSVMAGLYPFWLWTLRIVVPILVFIVLLNKIGLLSTGTINAFFGV